MIGLPIYFLVIYLPSMYALKYAASSVYRSSLKSKISFRLTSLRSLSTTSDVDPKLAELVSRIESKASEIRELKLAKSDKSLVLENVNQLLAFKAQYLEATGQPYGNNEGSSSAPKEKKVKESSKTPASKSGEAESLVITPRAVDYSQWYTDVISAADMVDQSPVRGCMVIKPWGMGVWDLLRAEFDERIRDSGTQNAYFPLLIPKSFLAKEAEHVDGFAKECAVVTHHRLCTSPDGKDLIPDPDALLEEPLIIRPTSETMIWHMFGRWISSYRDLPLKINQWANVVRWEMRTRPFLRSAEFLWQEGHTAHASAEEAVATAEEMLDMYASVCKDMLALPVTKGKKSPSERFAGAEDTYTIEALMQNGWALQSGTSHFLGQNFAKAFDVLYQSETGGRIFVWATSWGVSTRLLGAMVMTHSDDKGLVLPPKVAPVQIVIVPITKGEGGDHEAVMAIVKDLTARFKQAKIRFKVDDRTTLRPGAKYFEWERKGVPLRLEIGPRDVASKTATLAFRHTGNKASVALDSSEGSSLAHEINQALETINQELHDAALARTQARTYKLSTYAEMKELMEKENGAAAGFYLVPWKCDSKNEGAIKEDSKATIRCYPLDMNQSPPPEGTKCFYSGEQATHYALFARAF